MKKYITCNETTKLIGNLSNFGPSSREELYQQLSVTYATKHCEAADHKNKIMIIKRYTMNRTLH